MLRRPTFVIDLLSNGGFLKNKQITVQSSIVNPINLRFHSRAASFTTNFAAMDRFFAEATMLITCLFVSTSQICEFVVRVEKLALSLTMPNRFLLILSLNFDSLHLLLER